MKMRKRILCLALSAAALATVLGGCQSSSPTQQFTVHPDDGKAVGYQLEKPADGEEIAVLTTSMGEIKIRLFPDAAPKAVQNFKDLIKKGYYDGLNFHRVINDFMIQGGDPKGDGTGGESASGTAFEDEFNTNLVNLRGALSMANSGYSTNGSQFFIVQSSDKPTDDASVLTTMYANRETYNATMQLYAKQAAGASEDELSKLVEQLNNDLQTKIQAEIPAADKAVFEKALEVYKQTGGTPHLDYKHTVFGQVFEGMDVVDAIAAVETDVNDKPVTNVTVTKAELQTYKAS